MNPITRLIAITVTGLIAVTLAVVIGLVVLGAGHAHAAGITPHTFAAASHVERGGHGHRS